MKTRNPFKKGFTLVELLVVIAIIGLLASVTLAAVVRSANDKAKRGKAISQIKDIRTAIEMLIIDTGKGPAGCPPGFIWQGSGPNEEIYIDDRRHNDMSEPPDENGIPIYKVVGLLFKPNPRPGYTYIQGCGWTEEEIAKWNGPYLNYTHETCWNFVDEAHPYSKCIVHPWARQESYILDMDYMPYQNCDEVDPKPPLTAAIFAPGGGEWHDCQEIYFDLHDYSWHYYEKDY